MDTRHPGLPEYARKSIEIAARRLIGKGGLTSDDFDDVRSQIMIYTLRQLGRHDAGMAKLTTFVTMVVNDGAKLALRDHFAGKRQQQRAAVSLDAAVDQDEDGDDVTLADVLDAEDVAACLGNRTRSAHDQAILRFDVSTVISLLPENLRECCAAIMDGRTPTEIARQRGIPRSTFRDRVIAPIRRAFVAAGMDGRN